MKTILFIGALLFLALTTSCKKETKYTHPIGGYDKIFTPEPGSFWVYDEVTQIAMTGSAPIHLSRDSFVLVSIKEREDRTNTCSDDFNDMLNVYTLDQYKYDSINGYELYRTIDEGIILSHQGFRFKFLEAYGCQTYGLNAEHFEYSGQVGPYMYDDIDFYAFSNADLCSSKDTVLAVKDVGLIKLMEFDCGYMVSGKKTFTLDNYQIIH